MKMSVLHGIVLGMMALGTTASGQTDAHTFKAAQGQFLLDGKPFQVISGEMHYPRIPRAYWRARLRMAKAMGLNAITTYVFWNEHEPTPGVYDFSGNNDVAEFIREAQQEGLYVILRPGPYVCAEWEFGGYPSWLLKDPTTVVRSQDPKFMDPAMHWIKRLGQELAPLQIGRGGPIILVQVENEYGSFGDDHVYMERNKQALVDAGFTSAQLYTADGPEQVPAGSLPELPVGINFDGSEPGSAEKGFAVLKKERTGGPYFNSEFWAGWFDHWGSKHAERNGATQAANLEWMLKQGYSVSIYMFHGGTSFGFMNGANSSDKRKDYEPDVTSYDYLAPLDESGRVTPNYMLFRDVIAKATGTTPPPVPVVASPLSVPAFELNESVSLWNVLPKPIQSDKPLTMEEIGQSYGYVLYRTRLSGPASGDLVLDGLHDYAQIYLDGKLLGTLDRRLGQSTLPITVPAKGGRLDVLVENTGRINFSKELRGETKGITKGVSLAGKAVTGWEIYSLPMNDPADLAYQKKACTGDCFYRGQFSIDKPADTFLDTTEWGKGEVWLNGHALGRFWKIGPQKTLYVPGVWLKSGMNEVEVFDLEGDSGRTLRGLDRPNLGR